MLQISSLFLNNPKSSKNCSKIRGFERECSEFYVLISVTTPDLKIYHILYLEKHWIMQKDDNTYSHVLEDAKIRYERF